MRKIIAVLVVLSLAVSSANATVLFETDFEDYTTGNGGYETVVGQDGWVDFVESGGSSPYAVVAYSSSPDSYMPGSQWLYVEDTGDIDRTPVGGQPAHMNGLYRPFDAQTGLVHFEVLYQPYQSESSRRTISLRDSSNAENAAIAALVGTTKKYDDPGDRGTWFFAYDGDNSTQWDLNHTVIKENYYKIVIDANVAAQTYDVTVSVADYFGNPFTEVVSWTGLSFVETVSDISRVYVESWDSASQWDNFLIEGSAGTGTIPGDFDADNDVDGVDFGLWQAGFPMASGATLFDGDADADGDVDGVDFGVWQANYPTNAGSTAAIPEPATICLLALAATVLLARRRR